MSSTDIDSVVETLRTNVETKQFVDVGAGASEFLDVSQEKLRRALAVLINKGFVVYIVTAEHQDPSSDLKTAVKVLASPGTTYKDVANNKQKISKITRN